MAADIGTEANREFKGLRDCLWTIWQKDGRRGLMRGFNFQGVFLYRSCYFGLYDTGRPILFPDLETTNLFHLWGFAHVVSITAGQIAYPYDTVRRRMMMQSGRAPEEVMYKNPFDCAKKIY